MALNLEEYGDISNSELTHLIDEYIHSERDRAILKRRLIDGICYEPLAEEFDLSVRHTVNIVYKGEEKIYRHLPDRENSSHEISGDTALLQSEPAKT